VPNSNLSTFLLKKVSSSSLQTFEQGNDEYSYKINILNKPQHASGNQQQSIPDNQTGSNEQSHGSINVLLEKPGAGQTRKPVMAPNTLFSEVIIEDENEARDRGDQSQSKSYNSRLSSQNHGNKQNKNRNYGMHLGGGIIANGNNPLARKSFGDNFAYPGANGSHSLSG
jgi:hypothetical protein